MSGVEPDARTPGLLGRVLNILLHPHDTWDIIEDEPATIEGLYRGWVLPLAAIPAVCRALALLSFRGFEIFGVHYQPSLITVLGDAVASYALTLIGVYVLAQLVDHVAPRFGGERSRIQAFKLVIYAWTAVWVAGVIMQLSTAGGLFT